MSSRRAEENFCVQMGPFVDSEHPLIKQGLVDKTFKQMFHDEFKTRVSSRALYGALAAVQIFLGHL